MSVESIVSAELVRTADEWAETIRADLGRAVEGIVSAGRNLIAAKSDVAHGEWLPMLKQIGISDGYARKLMTVSGNGAISNRSHANDLPKSIETLYQLSRLDAEDIEDGIESGVITPNMTRSQARDLATPRRETIFTDPETGEETGRAVDDRDLTELSDDELYEAAEAEGEYGDPDFAFVGENVIECSGCQQDHDPAVITEMDTETLLCPPCLDKATGEAPEQPAPAEPTKPRRRALEEGFFDATMRLGKAVTSLQNLGNDDRLPRNKEKVARYRHDLLRAIDALQCVADQLNQ